MAPLDFPPDGSGASPTSLPTPVFIRDSPSAPVLFQAFPELPPQSEDSLAAAAGVCTCVRARLCMHAASHIQQPTVEAGASGREQTVRREPRSNMGDPQ